jgi:hypothetical protein
MMSDSASLIVRVSGAGVDSTAKSLDGLTVASGKADKASQSLAATTDKTARSIPKVGSVAQQAGYQIQDLVVQLQGGQSAFVAIGQQVPQFLGAFGPIGAITGTVVALGSALLGVAYNASQAEKDVSALVAAGQRLANLNLDSLVEANDISRDFTSPDRISRYKALSAEVINLSQQYENQALVTKRLREEVQAAQDAQSEAGGWFGGSQEEATANLAAAQAKYNESLRAEASIRSQVNAARDQQNKLSDEESKIKSDAEKAPAVQQKVDDRAARQAEAETKRLDIQRASASQYLLQLQQSNMTELALIDSQEQQKLAKIQEYRTGDLISVQQYEDAKTEIEKNASASRQQLVTDEIDAHYKQMSQARSVELAERDREAAKKEKILDDGVTAQRNMTNDLKTTLGEQNDLYKASAIMSTTIDTYRAATGAFAALSGIPIVGPFLGAAAAGVAVAAGLANVARIKAAREQGGGMMAGSAYQMAERGKAEIIVPAGASRARTAAQMRQIMGENGGKSSPSSVVIVNQTTGRIDSVQQEQTSEGQLRLIIREEVSAGLLTQDSQIAKARRQTSGQPGY